MSRSLKKEKEDASQSRKRLALDEDVKQKRDESQNARKAALPGMS
jgi:hypothetical protein